MPMDTIQRNHRRKADNDRVKTTYKIYAKFINSVSTLFNRVFICIHHDDEWLIDVSLNVSVDDVGISITSHFTPRRHSSWNKTKGMGKPNHQQIFLSVTCKVHKHVSSACLSDNPQVGLVF